MFPRSNVSYVRLHSNEDDCVLPRKRTKQSPATKKWSRKSRKYENEVEALVKAGVERFMLKDATIDDFLKMIRSAAKRESASPHLLTRAVFSRIVKAAIRKKEQQSKNEGQETHRNHTQRRKKHAKAAHRGHRPRQ
jgi:DNA-binding NarL/FixJ family response regulator